MSIMRPLSGGDPEFVILDKNNNPIPAWKVFDDQKKAAMSGGQNFAFRDGSAVEINHQPAFCRETMVNNAKYALQQAQRFVQLVNPDYRLSAASTVDIGDPMLWQKDAPADARKFGCEPSFNAYDGVQGGPDMSPDEYPFRHMGAHMHMTPNTAQPDKWLIGTEEQIMPNVQMFIKLLDLMIGLPLTYIFDSPAQYQRRMAYGKAGEFRMSERGPSQLPNRAGYGYTTIKQWDIEYRTPPSEMWNSQYLASLFFGVMRVIYCNFDKFANAYKPEWAGRVRLAIDTGEGLNDEMLDGSIGKFFTKTMLDKIKSKPYFHKFKVLGEGSGVQGFQYMRRNRLHEPMTRYSKLPSFGGTSTVIRGIDYGTDY